MIRGGDKFKAAMRRLSQNLDKKKVAKVGWFPDARYEDGTQAAYVAAIHEYGKPERGIPARSFIRPAIAEHQGEWAKKMADGTKALVHGNASVDQVLGGAGLQAQADIQAQIEATTTPQLSNTTLLLRKWRRQGKPITGKTVGQAAAALAAAQAPGASAAAKRKASLAGVNADPLRDTGLLVSTVIHKVEQA